MAFQTTQVSTVVAAHWMSPDAIARWRSFCGIFLIVTSSPCCLKRPASLAKVSGAKPVQPEMATATLVSWAWAAGAKATAAVTVAAAMARALGARARFMRGAPG